MSKRDQDATSNEGSPTAKARPCLVLRVTRGVTKSLHEVCDLWLIQGIPMKEKKWKLPLEAFGDSLQDQKSGTLKRVDKRLLRWPLETAGGRSNFKHTVMQGDLC